jgi:hypothetical protein
MALMILQYRYNDKEPLKDFANLKLVGQDSLLKSFGRQHHRRVQKPHWTSSQESMGGIGCPQDNPSMVVTA